jgi:hypothetical protein
MRAKRGAYGRQGQGARDLSILPSERRGLPATPVHVWPVPAGRRHALAV